MNSLSLKISNKDVHFKEGINSQNNYSPEEKTKLAKVSKDFENILTNMMLKSMTKTTDGLLGKDNYGGDVLDVIFENEISKFITESRGMGVAGQIYKNITGEELPSNIKKSFEKTLDIAETVNKSVNKNKVESNKTTPSNNAMKRLDKYSDLINEASKKYNVDKQLIKSVILTESAGKHDALSKANAKGLMQLMDSTSTDMGVKNPWNPKENIYGGTKYLSKLLKDYEGDTELALAAYNAGPGNVKKFNGIPPFKETQNYIKRVNNYLNILE